MESWGPGRAVRRLSRWRRAVLATSIAFCLAGAWAASALGATYEVDTTADNTGSGTCSPAPATCTSLRQAINTINAAPSPPDVIDVAGGDYVLTHGTLSITQNMSISGDGAGSGAGATTIDGNSANTVFTVNAAGVSALSLSGMNVEHGADTAFDSGGGIHFAPDVAATLSISHVAFDLDSSNEDGGGIYFAPISHAGQLSISDSTISTDTAGGVGGGIADEDNGQGSLSIVDSTISGNTAPDDDAGGLYSDTADTTLTNSTVSGNSANQGGGLYLTSGTTTLTNDTIADNALTPADEDSGAGIYGVGFGEVTAINTIVSANTGAKPASTDDCDVPVAAGHSDHSLEDGTGCGFDLAPADPDLEPLADNGGPTQTMALAPGSPAIDAGDPAKCPATDQRGYPRPDVPGTACDVGAYETQSPRVVITTPASGAVYAVGQVVHASYVCTAGFGATLKAGSSGCSGPVADGAAIDTAMPGAYTFTVVGTDTDGLSASATHDYTVLAGIPGNTTPPGISGNPEPGTQLSCSTGTWTNNPTTFSFQWYRDGTPLDGATNSTYKVQTLDEGTTLTCAVTAVNQAGGTTATSKGVRVPIPFVPHCPGATGKLSGGTLGLVKLGMSRARAHYLYRHHTDRGKHYEDFFCLTPIGVRVGYGSPKLLVVLSKAERKRLFNRVVWASTSNPYYSIGGVRPGESIAVASIALHTERPFHIGRNYWYLARERHSTAVLKVRRGVVEEVGIGDNQLTKGRKAQRIFMKSFY